MTGAVAGIGAAVVVIAVIALLFNRLIGARNRTRYAWSDVDALLVRRAAAIPRLASVVEAAMAHERDLFTEIATARVGVETAGTAASPQRAAAEHRLGQASSRLVAIAESYPQLRASEASAELIAALKDVEGDLGRARMVYNRTVKTYEDARQTFPASLVAAALGFAPGTYFEDA